MTAEGKKGLRRRHLLGVLGAGAATVVGGPFAPQAAADTENETEKRKSRYRETEEVKTYYRVNRYPS